MWVHTDGLIGGETICQRRTAIGGGGHIVSPPSGRWLIGYLFSCLFSTSTTIVCSWVHCWRVVKDFQTWLLRAHWHHPRAENGPCNGQLSFTFCDFVTVALSIINNVEIHHMLTLISSVNLQRRTVTWPCNIAMSHGRPPTRSSLYRWCTVVSVTLKCDEPGVENVARGRSPSATHFQPRSSYFNVARTTVLRMFCRMTNH